MRKTIVIIIAVLVGFIELSAQKQHITFSSDFDSKKGKEKIEKNLKENKGILEYFADYRSKIIIVKFDNKITDTDIIQESIEELGFKAEIMKAKPGKMLKDCEEIKEDPNKTENCCGR